MKPKAMILMLVAIGCGLAASYMTSRVIAERGDQPEPEKVSILVARKNLGLGTMIKDPEKLFEERQFLKGEEPKRAIRDYAQLKDHRLNKPISAEQFVTPDDLTDKDRSVLQAIMTPGMRAVAIKTNAESTSGGFVLPHSRVDIIHVTTSDKGEKTSRVIMQNVLILAVDQESSLQDDKKAMVSQTVTVEVTPTQATALALAKELGPLQLVLRSFGDEEKVQTPVVNLQGIQQAKDGRVEEDESSGSKELSPRSLGKIPDVPKVAAPLPDVGESNSKVHTLRIHNGDNVTRVHYQQGGNNEYSSIQPAKQESGNSDEAAPVIPLPGLGSGGSSMIKALSKIKPAAPAAAPVKHDAAAALKALGLPEGILGLPQN